MRIKLLLSTLVLSFLANSTSYAVDETYRLNPGDVLDVSVWGEESLQKEVRLLPDGSISFPLAGRVDVINLTTTEAEKVITEKLKVYLPDPQVTVVVSANGGNLIYVIGRVNRPGPILLTSPMTVMQALSMAGGLDRFAESDELKIVRQAKEGTTTIPVDYDDLIEGKALESNILLKTGDTILVP